MRTAPRGCCCAGPHTAPRRTSARMTSGMRRPEHVAHLGGLVDDLVHRAEGEVDEVEVHHRPHPVERGTDPGGDHRRLRDGHVPDPRPAELLAQPQDLGEVAARGRTGRCPARRSRGRAPSPRACPAGRPGRWSSAAIRGSPVPGPCAVTCRVASSGSGKGDVLRECDRSHRPRPGRSRAAPSKPVLVEARRRRRAPAAAAGSGRAVSRHSRTSSMVR